MGFLPQLATKRLVTGEDQSVALQAIVTGFLYKVVFSDSIAPFVEKSLDGQRIIRAASRWRPLSGSTVKSILTLTAIRHRHRVSGSSDINYPIILTSPMRLPAADRSGAVGIFPCQLASRYLYIPSGGNLLGVRKQMRNLIVMMLLGGNSWCESEFRHMGSRAWHFASDRAILATTPWNSPQ